MYGRLLTGFRTRLMAFGRVTRSALKCPPRIHNDLGRQGGNLSHGSHHRESPGSFADVAAVRLAARYFGGGRDPHRSRANHYSNARQVGVEIEPRLSRT